MKYFLKKIAWFLIGLFTQQDGKPSFGKTIIALPLVVEVIIKMNESTITFTGLDFFWYCAGIAMASVAHMFPINRFFDKKVDKK